MFYAITKNNNDKDILIQLYNSDIDEHIVKIDEIISLCLLDDQDKRKCNIINLCIENNIIKKQNHKKTFDKDINGNTVQVYYEYCKSINICNGHVSNYRSQCSSLCETCNNWTCSCHGFRHCCCYSYKNDNIIN